MERSSCDRPSDLLNCFEIVFDHCLYLDYFLKKKKKLFIVTILSKMFVKSNCSGQIFLSSKNCLIRRNLD